MDKKDQQIEELQKQVNELTNNWKRALADYQNLEKRITLQKEEWVTYAGEIVINKLLPVLDNLEKAEAHLKDEGLNIAVKQLRDLLKNEGLEEIAALGKEFDPAFHESVDIEEGEDDNKITEVFAKGYKLRNKLIRPAKVKVIKKNNENKINKEEK